MPEAHRENTHRHSSDPRSVPSTHVSQHTSPHTVVPRSEQTPHGVPAPPPAAAFPTPAPHPDPHHSPHPDPFGPPPVLRVVVVDDNPVVRAGLTALLGARTDVDVVGEATNGHEALALAERSRPDVILLDVRMPGVDGISALPHLVRIAPVLMLTYSSESEIVQEALRLGAGGYVVHGEFTADQLVTAIHDLSQGRAYFTTSAQTALLAQLRNGTLGGPMPPPLPEGLGSVYTSGVPYTGRSATTPPPRTPRPEPDVHSSPGSVPSSSHLQPSMTPSSFEQSWANVNRQQFGLSSREVEVMNLIAAGMNNQQIAATCFISGKTVKNHINRIFAKLHSTSRSEAIAMWMGTTRSGTGGNGGGVIGRA
ncbi:hypothetical protein GCM10018987_64970 [Streptomyces cremeus]